MSLPTLSFLALRLGVLAQIQPLMIAAEAMGEYVRETGRNRIYLSDIEEIARKSDSTIDDVRMVAEKLSDSSMLHYADSPDVPVEFKNVPRADWDRVFYAYLMPAELLEP